jgi:hypothetical protein
VVNIIEDWDVLEEYAGEKLGFYQLLGSDGMFEVRVQTGRVGFKREFEKGDDPLLNKILELTTALDFSSDSAKEPDGQQAEPWRGVCSSRCYHAKTGQKRCKCRCRGRHHGKGQQNQRGEKELDRYM